MKFLATLPPEELIDLQRKKDAADYEKDEQTTDLVKTIGLIGVVMVLIIATFLIVRKMK